MARLKYQTHVASRGGWTERVWPLPSYRFSCCDCGLVHDLKLESFATRNTGRGTFLVLKKLSRTKVKVGMKVRRNNRATGQVRRHRNG